MVRWDEKQAGLAKKWQLSVARRYNGASKNGTKAGESPLGSLPPEELRLEEALLWWSEGKGFGQP